MTLETGVSSRLSSRAITLVAISFNTTKQNKVVEKHYSLKNQQIWQIKLRLFSLFVIFSVGSYEQIKKIHTLSVRIPQSNAFESVSNKASTLRAAIRLQASRTVVFSGTVKALDSRNLFTVRSIASPLSQ